MPTSEFLPRFELEKARAVDALYVASCTMPQTFIYLAFSSLQLVATNKAEVGLREHAIGKYGEYSGLKMGHRERHMARKHPEIISSRPTHVSHCSCHFRSNCGILFNEGSFEVRSKQIKTKHG